MRPIDKFILHVVHNWTNELNEAYSENAIKIFIKRFREEADDLNITISDEQLRKYIERFDVLKNSPKITKKDLNKYTVGQLIRLVTSSPGAETLEDEEDRTPDVVYQDGGITIWNGSKEDNCITYGRGEKWCITRGLYGSYRYDSAKGYPTFYLAKNTNLSDSNRLSFVAIQVRDVNDENQKYVYTNRQNSPHESYPMSFSKLMSEVPWLNDIPNIRSILKYIPLSSEEKSSKVYTKESVNIREWIKLPFNVKKQYLVARKSKNDLFKDISREEFVRDYLPKYPEVANFIAITPGLMDSRILLKNLDKFSNQDRRSITSNLHDPIDITYLPTDILPFDVKKLLTILKKWNIPSNERIYLTKDGSTIVKLKFGDEMSVGLYQAEDDYPNIRLNKRTAKYLLDYPELDQLPFNSLIKLATDEVVDREFINPFDNEEVQRVIGGEEENTAFQQSVVNVIKNKLTTNIPIPSSIDKETFVSILKSTPYDKRQYNDGSRINIILTPEGESYRVIFTKPIDIYDGPFLTRMDFGYEGNDWKDTNYSNQLDEAAWRAYFAWMRNENKAYESDEVIRMWRNSMSTLSKREWFRAQPPFSPTDRYAPATGANGICIYYLINKANPRESLKLADSGKLIKANIPTALARQLLGATPDEATPAAQAEPGIRRRGRPAGGGQPRAAEPAAPAAGGGEISVPEVMAETGLGNAFTRLPRADFRRLNVNDAVRVNPNGDRGAARRNNQLGGAGNVGRVIGVGSSKIYIIRLANQQIIASINIQPGNRNYLLLPGGIMVTLNSPSELMAALQQRNLAEVRNYLVREYIANNPQHVNEVRELIQKHIAETKTQ